MLSFNSSSTNSPATSTQDQPNYLIFFLPGNPGFIQWYEKYLAITYSQLSRSKDKQGRPLNISIIGINAAGFDSPPNSLLYSQAPWRATSTKMPVDMDGQIHYAEQLLLSNSTPNQKIILLGHSLGCWFIMEILRRRTQRAKEQTNHHDPARDTNREIIGAIHLFPGLIHLARSPCGSSIVSLYTIPGLFTAVTLLLRLFIWLCPRWIQALIFKRILDYPDDFAQMGVEWMKSEWGARESLHLAAEELHRIGPDEWNDEVWYSANKPSNSSPTPLYFLFGKDDHWKPAAETSSLIRARARKSRWRDDTDAPERPWMENEPTGIPHEFFFRDNEAVALKTVDWVEEIVERFES